MLATRRDAALRVLRAILRATDMCALEPPRVAQVLVSKGITTSYDYARQTLQELPYDTWRTLNPEDTVRFYALRLHEVGMVTSTPQKLIGHRLALSQRAEAGAEGIAVHTGYGRLPYASASRMC